MPKSISSTAGKGDSTSTSAATEAALPIPPGFVLIQKVRGVQHGINPHVGLTRIGAVHTVDADVAAKLTAGDEPEFVLWRDAGAAAVQVDPPEPEATKPERPAAAIVPALSGPVDHPAAGDPASGAASGMASKADEPKAGKLRL